MKLIRPTCVVLALSVALGGCAGVTVDKTQDWTAAQLYVAGRKAMIHGDYPKAILRFASLEARYPYGDYAKRSELDLAYAHYKDHDSEQTIAAVDRFIRLHPTDSQTDYAYYLKGLAEFNAHRSTIYRLFGRNNLVDRDDKSMRAAIDAFSRVVTDFPDSRYAQDSYQRLVFLTDLRARNTVDVARFYYTHGMLVAAVNRTRYVIEHFQRTPAVEDALGLQALAYRRMGLLRLSDRTLSVLEKNFPKSTYIAAVKALPVGSTDPKPAA